MNDRSPPAAPVRCVLIDGYNVLHAVLLTQERGIETHRAEPRPLEWWQPAYQRRVVQWAEAHYAVNLESKESGMSLALAVPVTVVFDSCRPLQAHEQVSSDVVTVTYVPNADDWIVNECRKRPSLVVTADRALIERARGCGASSVKPWQVA
jgi:hypothetical protein